MSHQVRLSRTFSSLCINREYIYVVLHTIRTRYGQRQIYTYSGIVLIATNPFARVSLYEPEVIQKYSGRRRGDLEPHLFAIAEDAYRCMIREQSNQTIIVSGERYKMGVVGWWWLIKGGVSSNMGSS